MGTTSCVPAPAGSYAARYDHFREDGSSGADGSIDAADLTQWVADNGDRAIGGADALRRWPQLHCSLFRFAMLQDDFHREYVTPYVQTETELKDMQVLEYRMTAKMNIPVYKERFTALLKQELATHLGDEEQCPTNVMNQWMVIVKSNAVMPPESIPDLCAAAIYYLAGALREQLGTLRETPMSMEIERFQVMDARRAQTAGVVGTTVHKSADAPALMTDLFPVNAAAADVVEVLAIGGESILPMDQSTFEAALHGPIGSAIQLTIRTAGEAPRAVTLVRKAENTCRPAKSPRD